MEIYQNIDTKVPFKIHSIFDNILLFDSIILDVSSFEAEMIAYY